MEPENKAKIAQTSPALQSPAEQWSEPEKPEKTKSEKPEKSGKGSKIALALTSILALAGIAFGVYGFFIKKPSSQEVLETIKDNAKLETISSVTDVKEVDAKDVTEDKEVTITNQYVKDDLNRKISILTGISDASKDDQPLLNSALAYNEAQNFYSRGFESTNEKAAAVLIASRTLFSSGSIDYLGLDKELLSYVNEHFPDYLSYMNFNGGTYQTISYDLANKIYIRMFNETLPKQDIDPQICGYEYSYVDSADVFLNSFPFHIGGCGGTGFASLFVRKDSYKAKGDEAYVYAHIASAHLSNCGGKDGGYKLFNDFYSTGESLDCSNVITDEIVINMGGIAAENLDPSLLDTAADYRFVFKKNPATGTYYFVNLEKL